MDILPVIDDPEPPTQDLNSNEFWTSIKFFQRPLAPNDPTQSVGVYPDTWVPDEGSEEVGRLGPTLQRFYFGIHGMVKDADEERGQADHAEMAERIRDVLYNNQDLRLALADLTALTRSGIRQSFRRIKVENQKYRANEVQGSWYFLATIRFFVEVENRNAHQ